MISNFRRSLRLVLVGALGTLVIACASNPPPDNAVYVVRRPPRERVEVIGVAPGPGYVWIGGFWRWGGAEYAWVPGRWVVVERGYRTWVPGRWRRVRRGWYWVEGHWR